MPDQSALHKNGRGSAVGLKVEDGISFSSSEWRFWGQRDEPGYKISHRSLGIIAKQKVWKLF